MSGRYEERKAKEILGEKAWNLTVNAASGGRIDGQQMKDVAWALPTDREKDKVGAGHKRRMNDKGTSQDETEMKNILADWFHYGNMPKERAEALEVIIKVFEENGNKPLARELKEIKDNSKQVN